MHEDIRKFRILPILIVLMSFSCSVEKDDQRTRSSGSVKPDGADATEKMTVKGMGPYSIELLWPAVSGADHYSLYRDDKFLTDVTGDTTSYMDSDLKPSTSYKYEIAAMDKDNGEILRLPPMTGSTSALGGKELYTSSCSGCHGAVETSSKRDRSFEQVKQAISSVSDMSHLQSISDDDLRLIVAALATIPIDQEKPSVPSDLVAVAEPDRKISLRWSAARDEGGSGLSGYKIYRDGLFLLEVAGGTLSHTDTSLISGTEYSYAVSAVDGDGNESDKSTPAKATALSPPPLNSRGAELYAANCLSCHGELAASTKKGRTAAQIETARTTVQAMLDTSGVVALSGAAIKEIAAALLTTPDTNVPPIPSGLVATATESSRVALSWDPVLDTGGAGLRGYRLFRDGVFLDEVLETSTNFTDSGLTSNTLYRYAIAAVDYAANVSAQSSEAPATTLRIDGASLYSANCSSCHRPLARSAKRGRTAAQIESARADVPAMVGNPSVQDLTSEELQAIATALTNTPDTTAPSVPENLATVSIGSTVIALTWAASSDTGGSGLRGYKIYRGGTLVLEIAAPATAFNDVGLAPSTSYSYRIAAIDGAANESAQAGAVETTTLPPAQDTTAPPIPAGFNGTTVGSSRIDLRWGAVVDTGGSGLRGYRVFRDGVFLLEIAAPTVAVNDISLISETTYRYRISALDIAENESSQSAEISLTTPAIDGAALYTATCSSCHLPLASSRKQGKSAAEIEAARTTVPEMIANVLVVALTPEEIQAIATALLTTPDTTAPSVPDSLAASATGSSVIALSWAASTDTGGSGLRRYKIYRGGTFLRDVTAPTTDFNDMDLTPATAYSYRISAIDAATNESAQAPAVTATTLPIAVDTTAPPVPANLRTTVVRSSRINLSWNSVVDTGGSGLRGYRVFRNGIFMREEAAPTTTFANPGLSSETTYRYKISAIDVATNESLASAEISVTTPAINGVALYTATCSGCHDPLATSQKPGRTAAQIEEARTTVTEMIQNTAVQALSQAEIQAIATALVIPPDTIAPTVPSNPAATAAGSSVIALSWQASTDAGGSGLRGYKVYRGGTFLREVAAPATRLNDTGLTPATAYSYRVSAIDLATNESAQAAPVNATTLPLAVDATAPPVPSGLTATAVGSARVDLTWSSVVDTGGSGLRGYRVFRNGTFLREVAAPATTLRDSGLTALTTYRYKVSSIDVATNESAQSAAVAATTAAINGAALYAATCVGAQCHATLENSSKRGKSAARIEWARDNIAPMVANTAVQALSSEQIVAIAAALAITPDTTAPSVPGALAATATGSSVIALSWQAATDTGGSGLRGYKIYRGGTFLHEVAAPATAYNDTDLTPSTAYQYRISAIDSATNESAQAGAVTATTLPSNLDTTAPPVPSGLRSTAAGNSRINLSWGAVTDTGGSGLRGYRVFRNGTFRREVAAPATTFADTGLAAATTYSYKVSAVDVATNNSAQSAAVAATTAAINGAALYAATCVGAQCHATLENSSKRGKSAARIEWARDNIPPMVANTSVQALSSEQIVAIAAALAITPDTMPPSVPGALAATATGSSVIALSWQAATDTGGSGLRGYKIYRGGTFLRDVGAAATAFNDTGLTPSTQYSYRISAFDSAPTPNESAQAPAVRATTLPPAADTIAPPVVTGLAADEAGSSTINLSWTSVVDTGGSGLRGYRIFRNGLFRSEVAAPATTYSNTDLTAATTYHYRVSAIDIAQNESAQSAAVSATTAALDGPALYALICANCHGPLGTSERRGATALQIQTARETEPYMINVPAVRNLTTAQLRAIASALQDPDTAAPTFNYNPPLQNRLGVKSTLLRIFSKPADPTWNQKLGGIILRRIESSVGPLGGPCGRYDEACPFPRGGHDLASGANAMPLADSAREGYLITTCEEILSNIDAVDSALTHAGLNTQSPAGTSELAALYRVFYPGRSPTEGVHNAMTALHDEARSQDMNVTDAWRFVLLPLCGSPGLELL